MLRRKKGKGWVGRAPLVPSGMPWAYAEGGVVGGRDDAPEAPAEPAPAEARDDAPEEEGDGPDVEQSLAAKVLDKLFGPLPTAVQRWLKAHGDKPVSDLVVKRAPVQRAVKGVLDLASMGALGKASRRLGYDSLFHLWLEFKAGGKAFAIEKNQVLKIREPGGGATDSFPVRAKEGLTMGGMVAAAVKRYGAKRITTYDPFSFNCQKFISQLLSASGLLTAKTRAFIMQDVTELAKDLPGYVKDGAKKVTDVGAVVDRIVQALSGGRVALRKGGRVPRVEGAVYEEDRRGRQSMGR